MMGFSAHLCCRQKTVGGVFFDKQIRNSALRQFYLSWEGGCLKIMTEGQAWL